MSIRPSFGKEYYESSRAEMLPFIPLSSERILEIGCGAGTFGLEIKKRQCCEIWGIEIVEGQAQKASTILDKVIIGDVGERLRDLPGRYFDCIVCNDILEHLVDPYTLLDDLKRYVTAEGVLVTSIPNVRYYRVVKNLLLYGDWEYKDSGVLDKTHLRFFTRKSIIKTLEESGWRVVYIQGIHPTSSNTCKILNFMMFGKIEDIKYRQFAVVASVTHIP